MKGTVISFALYGGWRKMICMPENLKYAFGVFDNWNEDVLEFGGTNNCHIKNKEIGKYGFIAVEFSLEKSCYATMLIRELMHQSTEFSNQEFLFEKIKSLGGETGKIEEETLEVAEEDEEMPEDKF